MHIEAKYIISKPGYDASLDTHPSFLLLGRSNVGKSSFINALLNRKQLARTSQTPGKTIALNYYEVNQAFYVIDAPGYGYAKRSKSTQDYFYGMLNEIIMNQTSLVYICVLIDFKVGPTKDDFDVIHQLKAFKKQLLIIATKTDQIPKTRRPKRQKELETLLEQSIYLVSNTETFGHDLLRELFFKENA